MKASELLDEWKSGDSSGMRPSRVQQVRDDLIEHTGMGVPRRLPEIESWMERMKGTVTQKLREAADEEEDEQTESETDEE